MQNPPITSTATPAMMTGTQQPNTQANKGINGGRFDFDDGGTYCGGWEDGKAHGHGVCTGPKGQGAYSGSWHFGFEVSGVYMWPSGSTFEGQWQNGKRHGLGVETRGRWLYRGEWTQGFKGRYGVRQSSTSTAKYEGTWANGLQDGYGSETYADGGTFQGQWLRGMRHGYGVRASAPFGLASHYRPTKQLRASLTSLRSDTAGNANDPATERDRRVDDSRGGFVLKAKSDDPPRRRRSLAEQSSKIKKSLFHGLKMRKQRSTGDLEQRGTSASLRSTGSSASWVSTDSAHSAHTSASMHTDSNASFVVEDDQMDPNVTETYMGEWKNDKRSGFGISERSDGLKYEGEWFNNKKYGYGVTTLKDGSREEGKYKNNVLITSHKKKHIFLIRSAKFKERIDAAVNAAQRASKIALQKADIAISRTATARGKAELADLAADHSREDSDIARATAKQFAPDFQQPGLERIRQMPKYRPTIDPIHTKTQLEQQQQQQQLLQQQQQNSQSQQENSQAQQINQSNQLHPDSAAYTSNTQSALQNAQNLRENQTSADLKISQQPLQSNSIQQPQFNSNFQSSMKQNIMNNSDSQQQMHQQQQLQQQQQQQMQQQQQQQASQPSTNLGPSKSYLNSIPAGSHLHRDSLQMSKDGPNPSYSFQQAMSDHFDHYKRPPSRDSSVDRYTRATRMSRQPSADMQGPPSIALAAALAGSQTPVRGRTPFAREGSVDQTTGTAAAVAPGTATPASGARRVLISQSSTEKLTPSNGAAIGADFGAGAGGGYVVPSTPFEDIILRKKSLGQDIIPSLGQPKRTESLFVNRREPVVKSVPEMTPIQRKKSLPDVQVLPRKEAITREEASVLSSMQREAMRRRAEEDEKLRANPLLWLVSPNVKDWFSRQQLVLLVLFINISLAVMFFKLLT